MLVPILNYFSTKSQYKLRHVSYRGTSFCMPSSKKVSAKPLSRPAGRVRSLAFWKFLEVEKQVIITWCHFGTLHRMLEIFAPEFE
jgi:hypothetical protein